MIKQIFIILFVVTITFPAYSQLSGGLKGGLNINDIIITNRHGIITDQDFKTRFSYHIGSYLQQSFSEHFAWHIEMLFSNKGYNLESGDVKTEVSLNYINWPVLLVYTAGKKLDIETGLEFGLLVSGDSQYNAFDMGMDVGARYNFTDKINAGIRYNLGFPFSFNLDDPELSSNPPNYQNSVVQFYVGFNFIHEPAASK